MRAEAGDIHADQHFTQPPPRYTEASLVRALEEKGIGRPSTYAPTISTIITRGYVARENKRLMPTELGEDRERYDVQAFPRDRGHRVHRGHGRRAGRGGSRSGWNGTRSSPDFYGPFEKTLEEADQQHRKGRHRGSGLRRALRKMRRNDGVQDEPLSAASSPAPISPSAGYTHGAAEEHRRALSRSAAASCCERVSRKGRKFYGCEHYPDCDFVSWERAGQRQMPRYAAGAWCSSAAPKGTLLPCMRQRGTCRHRVQIESGGQTMNN